ncbi:MAG: acetyl/propionyl/methylcrotonyl-CoA carboxylase subunit alpha [Gammaproteobacteria bacterium]|nr:acetyl/propionyl/methylcrotonyl-CoA carboxylase subunit alpha [Gammaproteobacteria bacterium]
MFKKILVANRGEIACRIFRTAKSMGISTVAVYSDADKDALHVRMADESVYIGPSPSVESYLIIEKILDACKVSGADAVHPGYGFLSENKKFCEYLNAQGIAFIGPDSKAIESMGDKITSKLIALNAGVNTVPGYDDIIKDSDEAVKIAKDIGYPIMLKATAGGGGKGMRIAWNEKECQEGFIRATNEAISSFGDGRIFIEKYIQDPRHIEIQIMADSYGNMVYLGERECSIQRRHQKVIEEAPSPFLTKIDREKMGKQAILLAKAVDYKSAGTVEFIVDANKNFYFLEMNTRLQVEHPVTEMVTGLDLVELMIKVAAGQKLPLLQKDIQLQGWAIETRIYAEDPFQGFLPSVGRMERYIEPADNGVRIDSGIFEGGEVSIFYDPMISKLITYGSDRNQAIEKMSNALDSYYIRGVKNNISFLSALIIHPRFRSGNLTTNFINEEYPEGFSANVLSQADMAVFVVTASVIHVIKSIRRTLISDQLVGHEYSPLEKLVVITNNSAQEYQLLVSGSDQSYTVDLDGQLFTFETDWCIGEPLLRANINGREVVSQVDQIGQHIHLFHQGSKKEILVVSPRLAELNKHMLIKEKPDTSKLLVSPMPGLLVKLSVRVGDTVKSGQDIAVIEAMKMENNLCATNDGVVLNIPVSEGDSLAVGELIVEFE